jgi:hypothetical protein
VIATQADAFVALQASLNVTLVGLFVIAFCLLASAALEEQRRRRYDSLRSTRLGGRI